jgi:ribosomal 30S subunit maturation factor RimM
LTFILIISNCRLSPPEGEYYCVRLDWIARGELSRHHIGHGGQSDGNGANDVLIVEGERTHAIPFIRVQTILEIDLAAQMIRVDWDDDF